MKRLIIHLKRGFFGTVARGIAIGLLLLSGVGLVLAVANATLYRPVCPGDGWAALCLLGRMQTLSAGLLAAAGAIFAAWLAWTAVHRQVADARAARIEERQFHQTGICEAVKADLLALSGNLTKAAQGHASIDPDLGWTLKALVVDVAKINGWLAGAMITVDVQDLKELRARQSRNMPTPKAMAFNASFHAYLLCLAVHNAVLKIGRGESPTRPLLAETDVEEARRVSKAPEEASVGPLEMLFHANESDHATAPTSAASA